MSSKTLFDVNINKKTLNFIDIDDTIFRTDTKIQIVDEDYNVKDRIKSTQFNDHSLKENEYYDFSEYIDSELFYNTAKPINNVLNNIVKLIKDITRLKCNDKVIFLTAREDMNDKDKFLKTFIKHNIPIYNKKLIYIERAGNLYIQAHKAKAIIIKKYLNTGNYDRVRFVDDSDNNLNEFIKIRKEYPELEFIPIKVTMNGELKNIL